ncbi:MAG TPA: hypothetical protein VFX16_01130 [Pseudonocardiaceae bacterium]|nr:hypothetical protein [Pseudonocardiaceae bacterium]
MINGLFGGMPGPSRRDPALAGVLPGSMGFHRGGELVARLGAATIPPHPPTSSTANRGHFDTKSNQMSNRGSTGLRAFGSDSFVVAFAERPVRRQEIAQDRQLFVCVPGQQGASVVGQWRVHLPHRCPGPVGQLHEYPPPVGQIPGPPDKALSLQAVDQRRHRRPGQAAARRQLAGAQRTGTQQFQVSQIGSVDAEPVGYRVGKRIGGPLAVAQRRPYRLDEFVQRQIPLVGYG